MTAQKKNVGVLLLSFIFSPNVGGVESHLDELCEYLTSKNILVHVITYKPIIGDKKAPFFQKNKKLIIYRIPWIRWNLFNRLIAHPLLQILYLIPGILLFSSVYLLTARKKINVIQAHGFNMAITAFFLSFVFRIPFTVNTHVTFSFKQKNLYSTVLAFILNRASGILVLTEGAKEELKKVGIPDKKITVYHYWVDKTFSPNERNKTRRELGFSEHKFIVLFVGRFIKEKGVLLLVKAMRSISKDIKLIMIGSGPLEDDLQKMKHKNIDIFSTIDRKELPKWYSAADVTIIPSFNATTIYGEGIPRVMIESLSCGTPVVATKAGGLKDILTEEVGFFINPSSESIAKTITSLAKKRSQLVLMRKAALIYVKKTFAMPYNANKIVDSLERTTR